MNKLSKIKKRGSTNKSGSVKYKTVKPTQKNAAIKSRATKGTLKRASKNK